MAAEMRVDSVSPTYVLDLFGRRQGMELMTAAGLVGEAGEPPSVISKLDLWQLCVDRINLTGDEGHGVLPREIPKSSWGMVLSSVNQMATLGEGMKRFTELVPALQSGIHVSLGYSAERAHLSLKRQDPVASNTRIERYLDLIATWLLCMLIFAADREFKPHRVRVSALLDPADGYMLAGLSNTLERSGEGTTMSFRLEDLGIPLGVHRFQSWAIDETNTFRRLHSNLPAALPRHEDTTVKSVQQRLEAGELSQARIARELGLSVATLQRRLAASETSFRDLSRAVRRKKLASLLATDGGLDDIAEEMGFSDRRSLTRACRDWFGVTPSRYRQMYCDQGGLVATLAGAAG